MRPILLSFLAALLFAACTKDTASDQVLDEIASTSVKRTSPKITIWHYSASAGKWNQISINATAWPDHQAHGDVGQVGDDYQGGKIAYILQSGDPGYDANVPHGLIAAPTDQSAGAEWGCYGTEISGADGTAIGTGRQNTIDIMAGCATAGIAARICGDLVLNGYDDWFLPSRDEYQKMALNYFAVDGLNSNYHWTSTETDAFSAGSIILGTYDASFPKSTDVWRVRAIRSF